MYKIDVLYKEKGYHLNNTIYYQGKFYKNDKLTEWHLVNGLLYCHRYSCGYNKVETCYKNRVIDGMWHLVKQGEKIIKEKDKIIMHRKKRICIPKHNPSYIGIDKSRVYLDVSVQNIKNISCYGDWIVFVGEYVKDKKIFFRVNIVDMKVYKYPVSNSYLCSFDNSDWFYHEDYIQDMLGKKLYYDHRKRYAGDGKIIGYDIKNDVTEVVQIVRCPMIKKGFEDVIIKTI